MDSEEMCGVCHQAFGHGTQIPGSYAEPDEICVNPKKLACGHIFGNCLLDWLRPAPDGANASTCPMCRYQLFPDWPSTDDDDETEADLEDGIADGSDAGSDEDGDIDEAMAENSVREGEDSRSSEKEDELLPDLDDHRGYWLTIPRLTRMTSILSQYILPE